MRLPIIISAVCLTIASYSVSGEITLGIGDDEAVAVVNGEKVRFVELRARAMFMLKTAKVRMSRSGQMPAVRDSQMLYAFMRSAFPTVVNGKLLSSLARKNGIVADAARVATAEKEIVRIFPAEGDGALTESEKEYVRVSAKEDVIRRQLLEKLYPDIVSFPESDVIAVSNRLSGFVAEAEASNKLQRALCRKIMDEIKDGEVFADAAEKYSETDSEEGRFWTRKAPDMLQNGGLSTWAGVAYDGAVGGPFETEDGYSIVKLLERSKVDGTVLLAKITVARFTSPPIPAHDDLVKQMKEDRAEESMRDLLKQEHARATIEYPKGKDFWKTVLKNLTNEKGEWR